jgi:hypothetical protein
MPTQKGRVTLTDELRRERLLDIEARLRRFRIPVFIALGISLIASGPWVGWLWIGPLIPAIGVPVVLYKVMLRSRRPEFWAAIAWSTSPIIIAICVVMTGGPASPGISWFVLTAVTLGARFERRGVIAGLVFTFVLLLASTVAVDPHEAARAPQLLMMPVGLMFAVSFFSNAVVQSDRDHRLEAIVDPLTGLLNRAALQQRFGELMQQARITQGGTTVGFLVADLDRFKNVNDERGGRTAGGSRGDRQCGRGGGGKLRARLRSPVRARRRGPLPCQAGGSQLPAGGRPGRRRRAAGSRRDCISFRACAS